MNWEKKAKALKRKGVPEHVAIILDGNGRWARARGLSRSEGHRAGGDNLDKLLPLFVSLGIGNVSLYAFSTENWKRPKTEIAAIWKLLEEFFHNRIEKCMEYGIKIRTSGNLERIPTRARKVLEQAVATTAKNKNCTANFCLNYGSQDEILHAVQKILDVRLDAWHAGKNHKASSPVKKKSLKDISTPIRCLQLTCS